VSKEVSAVGAINEIVAIMIDIDIDASLDGMTAPYFREVIPKLKTPVRGGKLKAVSAEDNAFVGVLDNDCRGMSEEHPANQSDSRFRSGSGIRSMWWA